MTSVLTKFSGLASGAICILAGLYLLTSQTELENSYLEVLAHGLGLYFIGKGIYVGAALLAMPHETRAREPYSPAPLPARLRGPDVVGPPLD